MRKELEEQLMAEYQRPPGNAVVRETTPLINPAESLQFFGKLFGSPEKVVDAFIHLLKRETFVNGGWEHMSWKVKRLYQLTTDDGEPIIRDGEPELVERVEEEDMPPMVNKKGLAGLKLFVSALVSGHSETAMYEKKKIELLECDIRDDIALCIRTNLQNYDIDVVDLPVIMDSIKYMSMISLSKTREGRYFKGMTGASSYSEVQTQQPEKKGKLSRLKQLVGG